MSMPFECLLFVYFVHIHSSQFVFTLLFFTFRNIWATVDVACAGFRFHQIAHCASRNFCGRWWRVCCHAVLMEANSLCSAIAMLMGKIINAEIIFCLHIMCGTDTTERTLDQHTNRLEFKMPTEADCPWLGATYC